MHYYKRNLGDYSKKAGRLSMLQHGAYTLLIDACYDREQFPTTEEAIDWAWASSKEEIEAVEFVLKKFFTMDGGVHVQARIAEELEEYQSKAKTNKRIAREREEKRRIEATKRKENGTNRAPSVDDDPEEYNESPPNHKPLTINHKPIIKETGFRPPALHEVENYCLERQNRVDPGTFIDFYQSKNWMIGKTKMKDWKAAIRTWEKRDEKYKRDSNGSKSATFDPIRASNF